MELESLEKKVVGDIYTSDEVNKNFLYLCDDLGCRFSGSAVEEKTVNWLMEKLEEYGLENVHAETYEYFGWERGTAEFWVLKPFERQLKSVISLLSSPSTPEGGLEGEIFYVSKSTPAEFKRLGKKLEGKIVMCDNTSPPLTWNDGVTPRRLHRITKLGYAIEYGAIGFIFVNSKPGGIPPTGAASFATWMYCDIPAVGMSFEDGEFIKRQLKKGKVTVRIELENKLKPGSIGHNVCGEIVGSEYPEKVIIHSAHWDCHDIAVGANDNAAAVAHVLEGARTLANLGVKFKKTLRFCFWGNEESGLIGSTWYVEQHRDELDDIELMMQSHGAGTGTVALNYCELNQDVGEYMREFVKDVKYPVTSNQSLRNNGDIWPFVCRGVPIIDGSAGRAPGDQRWGHMITDTADKVSPRMLYEQAMLEARLLLRVANMEKPIGKRVKVEDVEKKLEEMGMAEVERIWKIYRWPLHDFPNQRSVKE